MAKTKILDLDKLDSAAHRRELMIGGKSYPIKELDVKDYIALTREGTKLDEKATLADQLEQSIEMILRRVPGVPREQLESRTLETLSTIVAFISGEELAEAEEAEASAVAEEAGK